jgi:hypothetical protein
LQKTANFLRGETIGFSQFEFDASGYFESSIRGMFFMQSLGMSYEFPDSIQMEKAREIQGKMPTFPKDGSVKIHDGFIVIKLSESVWTE